MCLVIFGYSIEDFLRFCGRNRRVVVTNILQVIAALVVCLAHRRRVMR